MEAKVRDLINRYYKATDWNEKGDLFFTIVDVYKKLRAKNYSGQLMTELSNIIVMG